MRYTGFEDISIVHESHGRIRLRVAVLGNPSLNIAAVEADLLQLNGVKTVRINALAKSIAVEYDVDSNARTRVLDAFSSFAFSLFSVADEVTEKPDLLNVYWAGTMWALRAVLPPTLRAVPTVVSAFPTIIKGVNTLISKGLKVEVLDATVFSLLLLRREYFTVSSLVFMLHLGHYLEASTQFHSAELLKSLIKPNVSEVWILDGTSERKVRYEDLVVGDVVIVGTGEMITVDGSLFGGEGQVDQSSVTGESLPVVPKVGDPLYAGTVVVEGRILIRAEKVGAETTTVRMANFIAKSLQSYSKKETKAYRMADRMVPITFAMGLAALALTGDPKRASAVLAVDYSCALKLTTPTAIKASMFQAAKKGVLIKGAAALERLSEVNAFIFDKTGTLTKAELKVAALRAYSGFEPDKVLKIAASAEEHYSHPIANAVVREAEIRNIELEEVGEVNFIIAHGVSAYVGELDVKVGSHHFIIEDEHIDGSLSEADAKVFQESGHTVLYVAANDQLIGIIAISDEPRPEARETIAALKQLGIKKTIMLSGDSKAAALKIAAELGLDEVYYELKPEDKADIVKKLGDQGYTCAFVGDGVNDAPALLSSSVGISLPKGSDLARDAAQVLLLKEDLRVLLIAKQIADNTMKVIDRVFMTNVGINTATVSLAVAGYLSPLAASVIHNGTTISTLIYALTLAGREAAELYGIKGDFKKRVL